MARLPEEGVRYWNLDTDFFLSKKVRLLRGEFGCRGVYIYVLLLNEIYRDKGYYKKWDADDCRLMSESPGVGGDCSPNLIAEIVQGCVRRSLFDKRVLDVFGVLTSAEIQRRFLKMVENSRDKIFINQGYFLLDTSNRQDVATDTLGKLVFFQNSGFENPINEHKINSFEQEKLGEFGGSTQSKVNKSKYILSSEPADAGADADSGKGKQSKQTPAKTFDHEHKAFKLAAYLDMKISGHSPYYKRKTEDQLQKWAVVFDRMNRLDEIPWDDIRDVLVFSQQDDFWWKNILSPEKFRKQYIRLEAEMVAEDNRA